MSITIFIVITLSAVLIAFFLLLFLHSRKNSHLSHQYSEAIQAENNGYTEQAIKLYQEALLQSQEKRIGDKRLLANIERRLKTLKNSTDFEKSFGRTKMAG
jgi:hypothetical protein